MRISYGFFQKTGAHILVDSLRLMRNNIDNHKYFMDFVDLDKDYLTLEEQAEVMNTISNEVCLNGGRILY